MNWKSFMPIIVAGLLGLVAAKVGWDVVAKRNAPPPQQTALKTTRVVVANDDVAAGAGLQATDLVVSDLPDSVNVGATFSNMGDLLNRVPAVPLVKGQAILETMLTPKGTVNGLSAVIPPGMRAITIDVNETTGVAGMLEPGCHVDVVMTIMSDHDGPTEVRTVADDVEILAIGKKFGKQNSQPAAPAGAQQPDYGNPRNVTLVVTPEEAHIVDLACKLGNPRFVLRAANDNSPTPSTGITMSDLRSGLHEHGSARNAMAATNSWFMPMGPGTGNEMAQEQHKYWTVQIIRGTSESTVEIPFNPKDLRKSQPAIAKPKTAATPGVANLETAPVTSHSGN